MPYDLVLYSNRKRGSLSLNLPSSFPNLETLQSFKHKSALHTHKIKNGPIILAWWEVYSSNLPINIPVFYFFGYFECHHGNWLKAASLRGHLVFGALALRYHALGGFAECCLLLQVWFNHLQGGTHFPQQSEGNLGNFCNHQKHKLLRFGTRKEVGKTGIPLIF